MDNVAAVFRNADKAVLIEYDFLGHTPQIAKAAMTGLNKVRSLKWPGLCFCVFKAGVREDESHDIYLYPVAGDVPHPFLTEIGLKLSARRKFRNRLIFSW